jgi:hypothetical protein
MLLVEPLGREVSIDFNLALLELPAIAEPTSRQAYIAGA